MLDSGQVEVAEIARSCPCVDVADLFDSAATKFARASMADVSGQYNHFVRLGVEEYRGAVESLNACPQSQQTPEPSPENSPVPAE
jgi:hypothetical protein